MRKIAVLCTALFVIAVCLSGCGEKTDLQKRYQSESRDYALRFMEDGSYILNGITYSWSSRFITGYYTFENKTLTLFHASSPEKTYVFNVNKNGSLVYNLNASDPFNGIGPEMPDGTVFLPVQND